MDTKEMDEEEEEEYEEDEEMDIEEYEGTFQIRSQYKFEAIEYFKKFYDINKYDVSCEVGSIYFMPRN